MSILGPKPSREKGVPMDLRIRVSRGDPIQSGLVTFISVAKMAQVLWCPCAPLQNLERHQLPRASTRSDGPTATDREDCRGDALVGENDEHYGRQSGGDASIECGVRIVGLEAQGLDRRRLH